MKNNHFKMLCLGAIITFSVNVNAQFIGGASFNVPLIPTDKNAGVYLGGTLDLGFYVYKKSYLLFNVGYCYGLTDNKVGTFSYSSRDKYGNILGTFDNGEINRNYWSIPVFVNWNWKIPLSDNFSCHIGPSVGETTIKAYNKYYVGRKEWEPDTEFGEKYKPTNNKYKALFSIGANVGVLFRYKEGNIGIGYKCLWNGKQSFDDQTFKGIMHQFTLSFIFDGDDDY